MLRGAKIREKLISGNLRLEQIALEKAMARLSAREKRILALRYYDGRPQMEVARQPGISRAQSRPEKNAICQIKKNMTA